MSQCFRLYLVLHSVSILVSEKVVATTVLIDPSICYIGIAGSSKCVLFNPVVYKSIGVQAKECPTYAINNNAIFGN